MLTGAKMLVIAFEKLAERKKDYAGSSMRMDM